MTKQDRREQIIELLHKFGSMSISSLAANFSVTETTIRNDFKALFADGRIQRVYGGAVSLPKEKQEDSLREKENRNIREKAIIGQLTAKLIANGETIMLDSGSTTNQVARNLVDHKDLSVITNGVNVLNTFLGRQNINLYTVHGQVGHRSYAIVGSETEKDLERFFAKTTIVSVDGVDIDRGLTNRVLFEANITKTLIKRAERTILVSDSSKIGEITLVPICPIADIDIFVTDDKTPESFLQALVDLGIVVYIARENDTGDPPQPWRGKTRKGAAK